MRVLCALPLLPVTYVCHRTMGKAIATLVVEKGIPGTIPLGNGALTSLCTKYHAINGVDNSIARYVGLFTPPIAQFDPVGRMQAIAFLSDLVRMVETIRQGNVGTAAQLV